MNVALLLIAVSLSVTGQIFLKLGVAATPPTAQLSSLILTFTSWRIIVGLTFYALSTVFWLFILKRLPLSIAYPSLSLSYVAIVFISHFFLGESVTLPKMIGIGSIVLGVSLLYL